VAYILCTCNQFAAINSMWPKLSTLVQFLGCLSRFESGFESPLGASCARLRHGQIKAKSKHNGSPYNPLLQQIKIYYPSAGQQRRGKGRRASSNKILANNRIIIPKGFTFLGFSIMWYALGTNKHTLRIRNLQRIAKPFTLFAYFFRYFVAR